jgi:hypothetical protein
VAGAGGAATAVPAPRPNERVGVRPPARRPCDALPREACAEIRTAAVKIAACHLPGQILEGVRVEQRFVELPTLRGGHL